MDIEIWKGLILILKLLGFIFMIIGFVKEFNSNYSSLCSRELIIFGFVIIIVCSLPNSDIAIEQIFKNLTKKK